MDPDLQEGLYDNFSELFAEGLVSVRNPDPMDIATAKYASGIISEEELMVIRRVHETAMKLSPSKVGRPLSRRLSGISMGDVRVLSLVHCYCSR